ncbi:MAG: polysaccharide deacetylase family protein [Paludibacteraceae bacterium]|nr:polysaccharide deacetylase family protein [Paludibacteraceae bacterium]
MVLIFTDKYTPRVKYIFEQVIKEILHVDISFTTKLQVALDSTFPVICYSREHRIPNSFVVEPEGLLFKRGVREVQPEVTEWNGTKIFFQATKADTSIPFDIFAAAFYLITRYEEYGCADLDEHGRFKFENSIAYKHDFLDIPLVDQWAEMLDKMLNAAFPMYTIRAKSRFRFCPSIDIDHVYKYKSKFISINVIRLAQKLLAGKKAEFKYHLKVLLNKAPDPYFNLEYIVDMHNDYNLRPIFFLHVGPRGPFDGYSYYNPYKVIKELFYRTLIVGLHPSYNASGNLNQMIKEKKKLETMTRVRVVLNRFHFLKFTFPQSFEHLNALSIARDYSLGYANRTGFRASTCTPFLFYNMEKDYISTMEMHPIVLMDVTVQKYMQREAKDLLGIISSYAEIIKRYNGEMVTLFHNESLSDEDMWYGWREEYKRAVQYVALLELHSIDEAKEKINNQLMNS